LAEYRAREAVARLNQEPYYSATPVREPGRRILIARPTTGAGAEARPGRSDSVLIEEDYIEMQTLQGTKGAAKRRRGKRADKPIAVRTMMTRMMCATAAGDAREGACNNLNLVEVTGAGLARPVHCDVDPMGPLGQHVSTL
jgi:hypothetical protein